RSGHLGDARVRYSARKFLQPPRLLPLAIFPDSVGGGTGRLGGPAGGMARGGMVDGSVGRRGDHPSVVGYAHRWRSRRDAALPDFRRALLFSVAADSRFTAQRDAVFRSSRPDTMVRAAFLHGGGAGGGGGLESRTCGI